MASPLQSIAEYYPEIIVEYVAPLLHPRDAVQLALATRLEGMRDIIGHVRKYARVLLEVRGMEYTQRVAARFLFTNVHHTYIARVASHCLVSQLEFIDRM